MDGKNGKWVSPDIWRKRQHFYVQKKARVKIGPENRICPSGEKACWFRATSDNILAESSQLWRADQNPYGVQRDKMLMTTGDNVKNRHKQSLNFGTWMPVTLNQWGVCRDGEQWRIKKFAKVLAICQP